MKKLLVITILVFINLVILYYTREPESLILVKKRYQVLLEHLRTSDIPEQFEVLKSRATITGKNEGGDLGYNMNKGYEIGVCLNGDPNDIFHVLLHELAHSTVEEYDHSKEFWDNFSYLKDTSEQLGIYERIVEPKQFCGKFIQD